MVTEFDGQDHRLRRRHWADNVREEKLESANLVVCRVDSLDLRTPRPLAEPLQARHAQGCDAIADRTVVPWISRSGGDGAALRERAAACCG